MGRMSQYTLSKEPTGVILKGHTRISCFAPSGASITEQPYIMSYHSDLQLALDSNQFWRSNNMMLDGTSITRQNADYIFPKEGALLYFYIDAFAEPESDTILTIHTEIEEKGDGF
jgi:hypothetical protein